MYPYFHLLNLQWPALQYKRTRRSKNEKESKHCRLNHKSIEWRQLAYSQQLVTHKSISRSLWNEQYLVYTLAYTKSSYTALSPYVEYFICEIPPCEETVHLYNSNNSCENSRDGKTSTLIIVIFYFTLMFLNIFFNEYVVL